MSSILAPRPDDRPPRNEEWSTGVTISIIAHASLIGALVWGLHWRSSPEVAAASAELWAAVPEAAAPAPVEAPPPPPAPVVQAPPPPPVEAPRPPDIVTEKIEEKKPPPKPKPAPPPAPPPPKPAPTPAPPPPKLDAKALAKLHDENVKRMLGQMDAPATNTGRAARSSGPSANWAGRVAALINSHLTYAGTLDGLKPPEIEIRLGVDGSILSQKITNSSGNPAYDDAVLRAVIGTRTLPRDTDGTLPPDVILTFKP